MMIRYADDFVCAFQNRQDAEMFYRKLNDRLDKFGLTVSPEKTRIIAFRKYSLKQNGIFDFNKKISAIMETLKSKYRGYWNYYGVIGNYASLKTFYYRTSRIFVQMA